MFTLPMEIIGNLLQHQGIHVDNTLKAEINFISGDGFHMGKILSCNRSRLIFTGA